MTEIQINTDGIPSFEGIEIIEIGEGEGKSGHKTIIRFTSEQLEYILTDDGECISFTDQFGIIRRGCFSDDGVEIYERIQSLKEEDLKFREKENLKKKSN